MLRLKRAGKPLLIGCVSILLLASCSYLSNFSRTGGERASSQRNRNVQQDIRPSMTLDILDEVNDGNTLSLVLEFVPKAQITTEDVELEVALYSFGRLAEKATYQLSQLRELSTLKPIGRKSLPVGGPSRLLLQQPIREGVTDYQVEAHWGKRERARPELEIVQGVDITEFPAQCDVECVVPFEVIVSLKNPFEKPIGNIWLSSTFEIPGQVRGVEDGAAKFSLGQRYLAPYEQFTLSLRTQTPLPYSLYQQGFRPSIRLSSFEFLSERH